jgi:hypothetical protein
MEERKSGDSEGNNATEKGDSMRGYELREGHEEGNL